MALKQVQAQKGVYNMAQPIPLTLPNSLAWHDVQGN